EFIADEKASKNMQSKTEYATLLLSNAMHVPGSALSNNFFNQSLLKRRIMMLFKSKSNQNALWKYGFSAPLFACMLVFSSAFAAYRPHEAMLPAPVQSEAEIISWNQDFNPLKSHIQKSATYPAEAREKG